MNFVEREKETCKFWKDNDIFQKSMDSRKEGETYTFYDGPPTANGMPHVGHIETRVMKDIIPRYKVMKGYYVPNRVSNEYIDSKRNEEGEYEYDSYLRDVGMNTQAAIQSLNKDCPCNSILEFQRNLSNIHHTTCL